MIDVHSGISHIIWKVSNTTSPDNSDVILTKHITSLTYSCHYIEEGLPVGTKIYNILRVSNNAGDILLHFSYQYLINNLIYFIVTIPFLYRSGFY